MAQVTEYVCDVCGRAISRVEIAGQPVPVVIYMVAGQSPAYSGAPVDLNAPGVMAPRMVRDLMSQPVARKDLCVEDFAKLFGLDLEPGPKGPGRA